MHDIRYIFERSDFVALTQALIREPLSQRLLKLLIAILFALHVVIVGWIAGDDTPFADQYRKAYGAFAPLLLLPLVLVVSSGFIATLMAMLVFKRNASANQEVTLWLRQEGVVASAGGLRSEVSWPAIVRVIDTPTRVFLALSRREALVVAKRGFASDEEADRALAFIIDHVDPATPLQRHTPWRIVDLRGLPAPTRRGDASDETLPL